MPELQFRCDVTPEDVSCVRRLAETSGFFHPAETQIAVELVQERLSKGPASGYFFVFGHREGQTVGYTCYGPIPGTRHSYDLYWIVVDPALRGHGIGRRLLTQTESLIREAGGQRVYIETSSRALYVPTRAFYEHNGYRTEAVLEDFYAPGDSKHIFVKALNAEHRPSNVEHRTLNIER